MIVMARTDQQLARLRPVVELESSPRSRRTAVLRMSATSREESRCPDRIEKKLSTFLIVTAATTRPSSDSTRSWVTEKPPGRPAPITGWEPTRRLPLLQVAEQGDEEPDRDSVEARGEESEDDYDEKRHPIPRADRGQDIKVSARAALHARRLSRRWSVSPKKPAA